jgi:hypothetical protein
MIFMSNIIGFKYPPGAPSITITIKRILSRFLFIIHSVAFQLQRFLIKFIMIIGVLIFLSVIIINCGVMLL